MRSTRVLILCEALLCLLAVACASDDAPIESVQGRLDATVCEAQAGQQAVTPSADGKRVAFLSCAGSSPAVVVHDLDTDAEVTLGPAPQDSSLEWLPVARAEEAQNYVLFGTPSELWVGAADSATETVQVADDTAAVHRAILQRVSNTEFAPRLHVLETTGEDRTLSIRSPDDGYATATQAYSGDDIEADLSLISASGRTVILTPREADDHYLQVQWNPTQAKWQSSALSFGPAQWVMAPVGLGDTHNFALHGDQLVRVELKTGAIEEIVAPGQGLLEGTSHLLDREDAPGVKYVYYILNGDPTRRDRDGMMAPETLVDANAVAQLLTPDLSTLLYLSDGVLYALPAEGGAPLSLADAGNETGGIDAMFPASGSTFAYTVAGALYRIDLADGSAAEISSHGVASGTVAYDGAASAILFLNDDGELLRVPANAPEPEPVAASVSAFWPIANSSKILAVTEGKLRMFSFDEP